MNGRRVSPEPEGYMNNNMTTAIEMQPMGPAPEDTNVVDPYALERSRSRSNNYFHALPSRSRSFKESGHGTSLRRRSSRRRSLNDIQSRNSVEVIDMDGVDGDEEDAVETVKSLPVPMKERREFRNTRKKRGPKKLSCWKAFKFRVAMSFSQCTSDVKEGIHSVELWKGHFKEVEGQFGNGVLSYFVFLKWLLFLNLAIFFLMFGFVSLPTLIIRGTETNLGTTTITNGSTCFAIPPDRYTANKSLPNLIVDFITGQGWINTTIMFYSNYPSEKIISQDDIHYDLPLAYLLVGGFYFLLSLLLMIKNLSTSFQESYIEGGGTFYSYCNKVFASWDYCTMDENAAKIKHQSIVQDINAEIAEEKRLERVANRKTIDKCKLYSLRVFISFVVITLLGMSVWAIYATVRLSVDESIQKGKEPIIQIMIRSAPSLTITTLNLILPNLFDALSNLEDWSPRFQVAVNLYRSVLLKVASLAVLVITLYIEKQKSDCSKSWENEIGAQMYMLILVDFVVIILSTVIVETLRKLLYKHTTLFKKIGMPEFQIPKNVLELVYGQCLIWVGTFFSPLIPSMGVIKLLIMFYVKKTSLMYNNKPADKPYQGARSNYLFIMLLLLTFLLCLVGVGWGITKVPPSCYGPFSNLACDSDRRILSTLSSEIETWPEWLQEIIRYISTAAFIFPALVVFCLMLYYFRSMAQAHVKMINMLRDQLVLEGRDKKYLMERLMQSMNRDDDDDGMESDDTRETVLQSGNINF